MTVGMKDYEYNWRETSGGNSQDYGHSGCFQSVVQRFWPAYQDYGQSGCFQNVVQRFCPVYQDYGQSGRFQNVALLAEILSGVSRLWTIRTFPKRSSTCRDSVRCIKTMDNQDVSKT